MKPYELKLLKRELKFGDISTIARECNVSTVTVHNALKGLGMTPTTKMILEHAQTIIDQRKQRINALLQTKKQQTTK